MQKVRAQLKFFHHEIEKAALKSFLTGKQDKRTHIISKHSSKFTRKKIPHATSVATVSKTKPRVVDIKRKKNNKEEKVKVSTHSW